MCGREPNFELSEEEKQELRQFKWDEFLAITRSAINHKSKSTYYELPSPFCHRLVCSFSCVCCWWICPNLQNTTGGMEQVHEENWSLWWWKGLWRVSKEAMVSQVQKTLQNQTHRAPEIPIPAVEQAEMNNFLGKVLKHYASYILFHFFFFF